MPPAPAAPVKRVGPDQLRALAQHLEALFKAYEGDRQVQEEKWLRNLRQYLGIYDPDIEAQIGKDRSRAYPRVTRVKCISVLSKVMNLMFPGNERNWELTASPSADMRPEDVKAAVVQLVQEMSEAGGGPPQITPEIIQSATQALATKRAKALADLIDDQLQEIGGDQTADYISLNRKVVASGIIYGMGVLRGPFVREEKQIRWVQGASGEYEAQPYTTYKPQFDFLPVWDFYPDMSAKTTAQMDGYFVRMVMSRSQLRKLADREDFFGEMIRNYLRERTTGNYRAKAFEDQLRVMGTKSNVNEQKPETQKYEIIVWNGPVSATMLREAGVEIPEDKMADDIEAEVWMVEGRVIKADMNQWRKLGLDVRTAHTFVFDETDTGPVGDGLPNVVRDSQMSIAAATRMMLDNASVVCGPNIEVNIDMMADGQDTRNIHAYKVWYRDGTGPEAQYPAVRSLTFDSHLPELTGLVNMFMQFADAETFVGPATGGDMDKGPSEPFRTAAGASMLRGEAALPFKDIVRNFDALTQSVINSLVIFNKKFNPAKVQAGDFNVIARGATSLIAKEIRGVQLDGLAVSLRPEDWVHVDERAFTQARFEVRDMGNLLVSPDEAKKRQAARDAQQAQIMEAQQRQLAAESRKTLAEAFKNITQGQKNLSAADVSKISAAMDILERGMAVDGESGDDQGDKAGAG